MRGWLVVGALLVLAQSATAQTPQRVPAGNTVFAMDVTATSQGMEYHLEVDGQITIQPAAAFTTGVWRFTPVPLGIGFHAVRARSCNEWGVLGGLLCSDWTPLLTLESVTGRPGLPSGFRVDSITVVMVP